MHCCYRCAAKVDSEICPKCGYNQNEYIETPGALAPDSRIGRGGRYVISRILGQGGFGITYLGYDEIEEKVVAIKEYFPSGLAVRNTDRSTLLAASSNNTTALANGVAKFCEEAEFLSRYGYHKNIVKIHDFFMENETAYMIMEYIDGVSLGVLVKQGGPLGMKELLELIVPVMDALSEIHRDNVLHRDISPSNILVTTERVVKLIDFGAARAYSYEHSKSLSIILKGGYAPIEQYTRHGNQGPWTDVYALCATMYYCLTGRVPEQATDRIENDYLIPPSEAGGEISRKQEEVLLHGMAFRSAERIQSVEELKKELLEASQWGTVPAKAEERTVAYEGNEHSAGERRKNKGIIVGLSSLAVVLVCALIVSFAAMQKEEKISLIPETVEVAVTIPDFVGSIYTEELEEWFENSEYYALPVINYVYSDTIEKGEIMGQEPLADEIYTLILGKQKCEMQFYISMGSMEAEESLTDSESSPAAEFYFSQESVTAGGFVAITATNISDPENITYSSTMASTYKPTFYKDGDYAVAFLPIEVETPGGLYTVTLSYGASNKELKITVNNENIIKPSYVSIPAATAASARTDATLSAFENAVSEITAKTSSTRYFSGHFAEPINGWFQLMRGFGRDIYVNDAASPTYRNNGIDYNAGEGTEIIASNAGEVVYAGWLDYTGNIVVIDHGYGLKTWYYNLGSTSASVGDKVERGTIIGTAGSTGFTGISGVHFAMSVGDHFVSPYETFQWEGSTGKILIPKIDEEIIEFKEKPIANGICGENVKWALSKDGVMTIFGTGDMTNYYNSTFEVPWYSYNSLIREIIIEEGVTSIGASAFYGCILGKVEKVQIADSVKRIENTAFNGLHTTEVYIPHNIEYIDDSAFFQCYDLENIVVSQENMYYTSKDGVLYDKNMTKLLYYPDGKKDLTYTVPESVLELSGRCLFRWSVLKEIIISENVQNILTDMKFWLQMENIKVEEENPYYCSVDGVLFNKDKTVLYRYPPCKAGDLYTVPSSVVDVEGDAFYGCRNLKTIKYS